jgi:hypothetical protein
MYFTTIMCINIKSESEGKKRGFVINSNFQAVFVQSLLDLFVNPDLSLDSIVNLLVFIMR